MRAILAPVFRYLRRSEKEEKEEESVAVPADWIGERVVLIAEGMNKRILGELAEVSDRGVVLIDAQEGGTSPRNPLFCPWGNVRFLELEVGREQAPE